MARRSALGARATSNALAETSGSAPETDAGTRPAVARGPESGRWMPRKKRPSGRASREWRDAGDALRTNHALASALRVATPERARDVLTAAVLCESLARGPGEADVRSAVTRVRDAFPSGAVRIRGVSVARGSSARHGYLVADAPGAVFVACAGTRDARDLVTDVSVRSADLDLAAEAGTRRPGDRSRRALAAHGGFASRARGLRAPVRALFRNAVLRDGKRLVLCGHSLGGAVAALALLGLLLDIEDAEGRADDDADGAPSTGPSTASDENENENENENVFAKPRKRKSLARLLAADGVLACVGFAAPPSVDEATRAYAETRGWTRAFVNVCSREDFVPRLMLAPRAARSAVSEKALFQSEKSAAEAFGETPADGTIGRAVTRNRAKYYASWRPAYAHVSSVHMVARDGAVTVVDARDAWPPPDPPNARRGDERPGGVFPPLGPFSFSARKAREALAEHTMRAHRARLLVTCADALAKARNDDDENAARGRRTFVCFARRFGFFLGFRGAGLGFGSRESGNARGGVADEIGLPPPAGDALGAAPQPRPATATAQVERDGESRPSLLVTVRGDDLELCVGVAAETNGWPCAATLVATEVKKNSIGSESVVSSVFVSRDALLVRVYPPTLNGALVPAPLFRGGGDARDWSRVVVALRGDFGDARVAARVADASGFAEPFRSRL